MRSSESVARADRHDVDLGEAPQTHDAVAAAAVLRIVGAIDDYLYTNEHFADGSRRSIFSGPNREKLMGGQTPPGTDTAAEWERLIHPDDWGEHLAHRRRLRRGEPGEVRYRICGYDGVVRWVHARAHSVHEDGRVFVDGIVSDVTRQVEAERHLALAREQLEQLASVNEQHALHDALTGLGNRRKLLPRLDLALTSGVPWLMALFDLDGFKRYNDTFGHLAGDDLLVRLATRLREAMPVDTAFRLGGDEFLVLTRADTDVEKLLGQAAHALSEDGDGFSIRASFGAAFLPEETNDPSAALHLCDQRLYNEKSRRSARRGRPQDALLEALHAREPSLEVHSSDVANMAEAVGARLGLDAGTLARLKQAALLHDIGKIGIPDSVLSKPGPLSDDEWTFIRRHTIIGERILAASPALTDVARIVRSTHERVDGTGYPDGLRGGAIPIEARIISVCDAYSSMTSERTYRPELSQADAIRELELHAGTQFDPTIVELLAAVMAADHSLLADEGQKGSS
jgi:diguanylate cyclase (GGDEF)-like protein/putative nucleotidyltransferase with HDIG domain